MTTPPKPRDLSKLEWADFYRGKYLVSRCGKIKNARSGRILKATNNGHGYLAFTISDGGIRIQKCVHTVVAHCYLGPRPDGLSINHIDGNKKNNNAINLE